MPQDSGIKLEGLDELNDVLGRIAPKHARNLIRSTVHGAAGELRNDVKKRVPSNTGNLKRSIKVKRRRGSPDKPVSEVRADHGPKAKHDGFYWRFVEHGTSGGRFGPQPERPFLRPARDAFRAQYPQIVKRQFLKKFEALTKRELKKQAKAKKK